MTNRKRNLIKTLTALPNDAAAILLAMVNLNREGISRTDLNRLALPRGSKTRNQAIEELVSNGILVHELEDTDGRPVEVFSWTASGRKIRDDLRLAITATGGNFPKGAEPNRAFVIGALWGSR